MFFPKGSRSKPEGGVTCGSTFPRIILLVLRQTETFLSWKIVFLINKHLVFDKKKIFVSLHSLTQIFFPSGPVRVTGKGRDVGSKCGSTKTTVLRIILSILRQTEIFFDSENYLLN